MRGGGPNNSIGVRGAVWIRCATSGVTSGGVCGVGRNLLLRIKACEGKERLKQRYQAWASLLSRFLVQCRLWLITL